MIGLVAPVGRAQNEATYLPANLHCRVHDQVGLVEGLSLGLALVLPKLLHCQYTQLDSVSSKLWLFAILVQTIMASEDPIVEVPIMFASSVLGALNSRAIMETHPVYSSVGARKAFCLFSRTYGSGYRR